MTNALRAGDVFHVRYPFVRDTYMFYDEDGLCEAPTWRPGVSMENAGPYGDVDIVAHAEGQMILTVIDVHKPGRFPARVFYTRKFVDPDGKSFGKGSLKITTVPAFMRRTTGFLLDYDIEDMGAAPATITSSSTGVGAAQQAAPVVR